MRINITCDNTVGVSMTALCALINARSQSLSASTSSQRWKPFREVMHPYDEFSALEQDTPADTDVQVNFFVTCKPFIDNFFYHGNGRFSIISLYQWDRLTDLPMSNGVIYMMCQTLLGYRQDIGESHDDSTGCLNDFMWDKSAIDLGMRAASYCPDCRATISRDTQNDLIFKDLMNILDYVSHRSRQMIDVLEGEPILPSVSKKDEALVFLCHNSRDKPDVRVLNEQLSRAGITTWFDEECIEPGEIWQDVLERQIASVKACLVIVGSHGEGPWQEMERRAFIAEFIRRECRVIPVLIGEGETAPKLPLLLEQFMWSDLRTDRGGTQLSRLIGALLSL